MNDGGNTTIQPGAPQQNRRALLYLSLVILSALVIGLLIVLTVFNSAEQSAPSANEVQQESGVPAFKTEVVKEGLDHPWEVAFLPNKNLIYTERRGTISIIKNNTSVEIAKIADVKALGEGGLLGLAVDPKFDENRYIYTCFNSEKAGVDVRVVRWKLTNDETKLIERNDLIVGMPAANGGRHSGCRLAFGPDNYLWIGTGDAAMGQNPQSPIKLGGKILRIDRDGKPAPGNMGPPFDERIYSYGHRNVQGIAFAPQPVKNGEIIGYSIEHGSSEDDEINPLLKGNFGWDPPLPYEESGTPMTDKQKYPNAIDAFWTSGTPTLAPSGGTFLSGKQWKAWNGMLAVAFLKDKQLKLIGVGDQGEQGQTTSLFKDQFGRLRSAVQGPDGNLYITTDNGTNDKIMKIIPE